MKKPQAKPERTDPDSLEDKRRYPLSFTTTAKSGKKVLVRYRRVPTRDGHDIEAKIVSLPESSEGKE